MRRYRKVVPISRLDLPYLEPSISENGRSDSGKRSYRPQGTRILVPTAPSAGGTWRHPMPERFAKFSAGLQLVFLRAREEAQRLHHQQVGPEHLLLGLLQEAD